MYEMAGDTYPTTRTLPYIKKYLEGILMYEIAEGVINKYANYADPIVGSAKFVKNRPICCRPVDFNVWSTEKTQ